MVNIIVYEFRNMIRFMVLVKWVWFCLGWSGMIEGCLGWYLFIGVVIVMFWVIWLLV